MEYMQRVHSSIGCSPNRMVYAIAPRLPPTVGDLRWDSLAASASVVSSTVLPPHHDNPNYSQDYLCSKDETVSKLISAAHDRILARQHDHAAQQHARRARRRKGGKQLKVGDLAYLLTRTGGFKPDVKGPFVVESLLDNQVTLRTTALVPGQVSKSFDVHVERVARATTVTDVLEDLLKHARIVQEIPSEDPDTIAARHIKGVSL